MASSPSSINTTAVTSLVAVTTDRGWDDVTDGTATDPGYYSAQYMEDFLSRKDDEFAVYVLPAMLYVGILMIIGIPGNVMVLVVYNRLRLRTTGTYRCFVQALAVYDLLSCLIGMPGEIVDMRRNYTFGTSFFCKIFRPVTVFCSLASGVTLVMVAVDRYRQSCRPFAWQITPKTAKGSFSVLLVVVSLLVCGQAQLPNPDKLDMFGLINILYWKADSNRDGTITENELQTIWDAFDSNGDQIISPEEFIPHWAAVTTMSLELSKAYFFLADIDDSGLITGSDLNLVYQRFDINGDGTVTAEEFNLKWQQLYREAPFAVLYLRADSNGDDDLQTAEFGRLFSSLGSKADGSVTKAEFTEGWTAAGFGSSSAGAGIFSHLDTDHNGVLTTQEVSAMEPHYDFSHNGKVELMELVEMAKLTPTPPPSK